MPNLCDRRQSDAIEGNPYWCSCICTRDIRHVIGCCCAWLHAGCSAKASLLELWALPSAHQAQGIRVNGKPKAWSFIEPHRMTSLQYSSAIDACSSTNWVIRHHYFFQKSHPFYRSSASCTSLLPSQCHLASFQRCPVQVNTSCSDPADMPAKPHASAKAWPSAATGMGMASLRKQLCGPFTLIGYCITLECLDEEPC